MPNIGMTELLLIGLVALIVVGPKDLPGMFRTLGRFTAKARSLGREFTRAMNEAADEAGATDITKTLRDAANPAKTGLNALKDAADRFEKWEPAKPAASRGGETAKLAEERAEIAKKIHDTAAKKAEERLAREAPAAAPAKPAAKKPTAKKPAAKKPAAKKAAPKKPAAKKPAAKKPAAKKPAAQTSPAKNTTARKAPAKKPAAKAKSGKSDA